MAGEIEIERGGSGSSRVGKAAVALFGGAGLAISVACLPFALPALRKVCLPYVPATDAQLSNVVAALRHRGGALVDVGSGDGRVVLAAAARGFRADGVELNPWLVGYSRVAARLKGVDARFYSGDLWKFDLAPYDNVVVFGVEEMMEQLERKIRAEVKRGTTVVACRFPFANMRPEETVGRGIDAVWRYTISDEKRSS